MNDVFVVASAVDVNQQRHIRASNDMNSSLHLAILNTYTFTQHIYKGEREQYMVSKLPCLEKNSVEKQVSSLEMTPRNAPNIIERIIGNIGQSLIGGQGNES